MAVYGAEFLTAEFDARLREALERATPKEGLSADHHVSDRRVQILKAA
jgi:hypothetical protein